MVVMTTQAQTRSAGTAGPLLIVLGFLVAALAQGLMLDILSTSTARAQLAELLLTGAFGLVANLIVGWGASRFR